MKNWETATPCNRGFAHSGISKHHKFELVIVLSVYCHLGFDEMVFIWFFFHDIILFFSFSLEAHHFNSSKNTEYSWYRGVVGGGTKKVHNKCVFKIGDNIFSEQQKLAEALFFNFRSIFLKDYVTTLWFDEK